MSHQPKVLSDLIEALAQHRKLLVIVYLGFLIIFITAFLLFTSAAIPQFFHTVFNSPDSIAFTKWEFGKAPVWELELKGSDRRKKFSDGLYNFDKTLTKRIICVIIFFLMQFLFIWGENYYHAPARYIKIFKVSLLAIIGSCMLALLVGASVLSFLEFGDRYIGLIRGGEIEFAFAEDWLENPIPPPWFWQLVLGVWVFWLLMILMYTRWAKSNAVVAKLMGVIIYGSWINAVVALMVDLSVRPRYIGCLFLAGSWFALIISVPVLFWSIGPGIYLLYLGERGKRTPQPDERNRMEPSQALNAKDRH